MEKIYKFHNKTFVAKMNSLYISEFGRITYGMLCDKNELIRLDVYHQNCYQKDMNYFDVFKIYSKNERFSASEIDLLVSFLKKNKYHIIHFLRKNRKQNKSRVKRNDYLCALNNLNLLANKG